MLNELKNLNIPIKKVHSLKNEIPPVQERNKKVLKFWVPRWTLNAVENYHVIDHQASLGVLKGRLAGQPAVIVGAGPSLDKNIKKLRDFPGIIFSSNSAFIPLMANGINPEFVIAFDCNDYIRRSWVGVDTSKFLLITSTSSHPSTIQSWKGDVIYFNLYHPDMDFFEQTLHTIYPNFPGVPNSGCVANTGIRVASFLGCSPIILAGIDYGFPGGRYRCTNYQKNGHGWEPLPVDNEAINKYELKEENGVKCWAEHLAYREGLLHIYRNVLVGGKRLDIINATGGGILGDDIPRATLAEVKEDIRLKERLQEINFVPGAKGRANTPSSSEGYIELQTAERGAGQFEFDSGRVKYAFRCIAQIPQGVTKLLEMGCSTGYQTKYLAEIVKEVFAIDLSPACIEEVNRRFLNVKAKVMDMHELSYKDNMFDCIFANNVLEHAHDPKQALSEIYRTIQPGGILLAWIPPDARNRAHDTKYHLWKTDKPEIRQIMAETGFQGVEIEDWDTNPYGIHHPPSHGHILFVKGKKPCS